MTPSSLPTLPAPLAERTRALNDAPLRADRPYVLYWAHHALRDHDHPALDVALHLGAQIGRPVLVYQGLGGGHPFDADRHHAFILQGARSLHHALGGRGIRHVTHLPGVTAGRGLVDCLAGAAALVCEDFPAPPFPRWTSRWARRSPVACFAVDAACIVPMAATGKRFERAFAFRQSLHTRFEAELEARPWAQATPVAWPDGVPLPIQGIDWSTFDLAQALGACAIDHGLPPVPDTEGGSEAGYARWARFKAEGLPTYHALRNDAAVAPPRGVSRLSPYLHYGMVSPWRLAREARALGGPGPDKFIDELWVWRELAWQWCWHTAHPESPDALPEWARDSFAAHADDPRPALSDEALHRGRSGAPLWDLAQRSLLRHGELHNNLRMTWGKSLVAWSADIDAAMRRLRDLNHRFALDGSDPASYGGLWWCLGLFDRPFDPPQPVLGRLRARPLEAHERRLDTARYAGRVNRGATAYPRVAIVGAGLAGASAAQALIDQGYAVTVFDKSRGVGGRLSTRRTADGPFDHGAQLLRAHDPRFRRQVARWVEAGLLGAWQPRRADGTPVPPAWVAKPGMNALVKPMLDGVPLRLGRAVDALRREHGVWRLEDEAGELLGEAEQLIMTAPAPQASMLLRHSAPGLAARLAEARYAPCWAALVTLEAAVDCEAVENAGEIAWAAADASRPDRPPGPRWVVHAHADWSRAHLEADPEWVGAALANRLSEVLGTASARVAAHRWRYARVEQALGQDCLVDSAIGLRVAGDYCLGGRLEAAWLSGQAAAGSLMRTCALDAQAGRCR